MLIALHPSEQAITFLLSSKTSANFMFFLKQWNRFNQKISLMANNIWRSKIISGLIISITLTIFSDYPFHLLARLEADTLKNMLSLATAFASKVFPVPGGPNSKMPFIAFLIPLKNSGIILGKRTASCSKFFAF